jgi:F0F1-type ATP synthase membrane subunit b/b'
VKKKMQIFLLAASTVLVASVALAAGSKSGHYEAPGLASLFWPTVNFIIYALLINYGYRKIGKPAMISHSVQVRDDLKRAAKSLADAESLLAQAESRRENISEEKAKLIERLQEEGKAVAINTLEDAHRQAEAIQSDAKRRIKGETAKARSELLEMVVKKATDLARDDFQRELSAEQDMNLRKAAVISVLN